MMSNSATVNAAIFTPDLIRRAAAKAGVEACQITGPGQSRKLYETRWAIMVLMHRRNVSNVKIGQRLNRHHTTVMSGLKRAEELAAKDEKFAAFVAALEAEAWP